MQRFSHGGNVYEAGQLGTWLDFSANINPLGMSARVKQVIGQHIEALVHYPDPAGGALKEALSAYYQVPTQNLVLGNGAAELLYVFFHCVRPHRVLLPVPSFSEYERAARASGADILYQFLRPEDDFAWNGEQLQQRLPEADCVVLANPNNPTGNLYRAEIIRDFLEAAAVHGVWVIVDESFLDFRMDRERYTAALLAVQQPQLLVLQSLTKFYAIPGLRLGFGISSVDMVNRMELSKDPWNVNLLAQQAGGAALRDKEYQQRTRQFVRQEALLLAKQLRELPGIRVYEPTVNFILLAIHQTGRSAPDLVRELRRQEILVRDCSNYPGLDDGYIRIAVRQRDDNERLLAAMRRILEVKV